MKCKYVVFIAVMSVMAASCWSCAVMTGGMKDAGKTAAVANARVRGEESNAVLVATTKKKWKLKYAQKEIKSPTSVACVVFYAENRAEADKAAGAISEQAGLGKSFCYKCGAKLDALSALCSKCGTRQKAVLKTVLHGAGKASKKKAEKVKTAVRSKVEKIKKAQEEYISIVLHKEVSPDITVSCPPSINMSFKQMLLGFRFELPSSMVKPKDGLATFELIFWYLLIALQLSVTG